MNEVAELGEVLRSSFFDDREFRDELAPINKHFEKIGLGLTKDINPAADPGTWVKSISVSSGFNQYLVCSFHAAVACENLQSNSANYLRKNKQNHPYFMTFQHAFGLEAVINLSLSKSLLTNADFCRITKVDGRAIRELYDRHFPFLSEARNSLAHQDERSLGQFSVSKARISGEPAVQLPWQKGAQFGGLTMTVQSGKKDDKCRPIYETKEFDFSFKPKQFLGLLCELKKSLGI